MHGFRGFLLAAALVGVPAVLILKEPDLGTMLTLMPATALMLFVARVWWRALVVALCAAAIGAAALLGAVYEAEKPGVPEARRAAIMKYVSRDVWGRVCCRVPADGCSADAPHRSTAQESRCLSTTSQLLGGCDWP